MTHVTLLMALEILGLALVPLVGFTLVVGLQLRFLDYLKSAHRDVWENLGSPGIFQIPGGISNRPPLQDYLLFRRYRGLGDHKLTKLGNAASLALWTMIAAFIAIFAYCWIRPYL